ncbi:MAG: hypothetical protein J6U87_06190, partial [Clostridia bacterium]|nr:hypothetical protein [Clostridia bacterium]
MQKLNATLTNFKVRVDGISYVCGPAVTRYEVRPAPGVRVRSIANLADDIAMSLAAKSIRIEAPIPGKEAVGIEGSSMYLIEGEVLTVQELLYGLMLSRGNDAAVALAIWCGGTVEGFAELMNDKARSLGLRNTHFVNPHGLDAPDH